MAIHMFQQLIDTLKKSPKRIVFTEGTDARILEASARLLAGTWLAPILIGNEAEVKAAAEEVGFNIRGAEIIDPATYPDMDKMVEEMVALRRGKMTADECRAALMKGNYFGTMLVKMGVADCLLGGATYSTADTVRPALQLIKTKPENKIVSSCFIMVREGVGDNTVLAMGDCAINIDPTEDELVEIGLECAKCAKIFGIDPKVAYLSYSTKGSGKGDDCGQDAQRLRQGQGCRARAGHRRRDAVRRRRLPHRGPAQVPRLSRWPAMPTPSFSPTSTPATSATRSPSAWAASTPTAPSCWA